MSGQTKDGGDHKGGDHGGGAKMHPAMGILLLLLGGFAIIAIMYGFVDLGVYAERFRQPVAFLKNNFLDISLWAAAIFLLFGVIGKYLRGP